MRKYPTALFLGPLVLIICIAVPGASGAARGPLQVGAAKVDITPAPDAALPMAGYANRTQGFQEIHDHLYVRAIVLGDGSTQAAVVAWELIFVPTHVWEELSQRISKELGIPADNIIMAAVHDHSAPSLAGMFGRPPAPGAPAAGNPGGRQPSPGTIAYTAKIENDAFEAVRQAQSNLQPAQLGFGTGKSYVNINRREYFPQKGWWWLGYNPEGPSDKTLAVLKFTDLNGKPIALFINYPVHAVVMGGDSLAISGDLAGATSRFVEQYYHGKLRKSGGGSDLALRPEEQSTGDGPIALWTSGAAGDQNPVARDKAGDFTMVDGFGRIMGEEAVRVANDITVMSKQLTIRSAQKVVTCPGRRVTPGDLPRKEYTFEDSDPVNIRLSLLMLNNIALAGVSGEVFTRIYQHLKHESPFNSTMMITHTNGSSGYIPSDEEFEPVSYEVTTSRLKPGCAEPGIVNGFLEMMGSQP